MSDKIKKLKAGLESLVNTLDIYHDNKEIVGVFRENVQQVKAILDQHEALTKGGEYISENDLLRGLLIENHGSLTSFRHIASHSEYLIWNDDCEDLYERTDKTLTPIAEVEK